MQKFSHLAVQHAKNVSRTWFAAECEEFAEAKRIKPDIGFRKRAMVFPVSRRSRVFVPARDGLLPKADLIVVSLRDLRALSGVKLIKDALPGGRVRIFPWCVFLEQL